MYLGGGYYPYGGYLHDVAGYRAALLLVRGEYMGGRADEEAE